MPMGRLPCLFSKSMLPQCSLTFSEPSMLTFKTPSFKPHWLQELTKFGLSLFSSQLLWGFAFPRHSPVLVYLFPFCVIAPSSPLQQPQSISLSSHIPTLPTLFNVSSSLPSVVEFFFQFSDQFLWYLGQFHSYLVAFMGHSEDLGSSPQLPTFVF